MFLEEAIWFRDRLAIEKPPAPTRLLDIGSSTERFRRLDQPHIDFHVFLPLRRRGWQVVHVDARDGEGIDRRWDVTDPTRSAADAELAPGHVVLCSNLLEHVTDRDLVCRRLFELCLPGGLLLLSAPRRYRHHEDPIDTGFRPLPRELHDLFSAGSVEPVREEVLEVEAEPRPIRLPSRLERWHMALTHLVPIRGPAPPPAEKNQVSIVALRRK